MTCRRKRSLENVCFALILLFSLLITLHAATAVQQYDDDLRPDLKITSMDFFPSNPKLGQNVTIFYTIENVGDLNVYGPVESGLFINGEDTAQRDTATNDFDPGKLRPGERIHGEFHYVFDMPEHKGSNRVEIRSDIDNTILEGLEFNNEYEKLIFIRDAGGTFQKGILQVRQAPDTRPAGDDYLRLNQPVNQIVELVREENLDILQSRYFSSETDRQRYRQTITLGDSDLLDSDIRAGRKLHSSVVYDFDEDNELADYLFFDNGKDIFTYELEFMTPFEASINNSRLDIEGEIIQILGENYIITGTDIDENELELELTKGESLTSLREGEVRSFDIDGERIDVELLVIRLNDDYGEPTVTFRINDILLKNMKQGEVELVDELDFIVAVNELELIEEEGRPDYVELFLGTKRLELEDNFADNDFSSRSVEINGENIRGSGARIKARLDTNNTQLNIESIAYKLEAYTDLYVPVKTSLSQHLKDKSRDNRDSLLSRNFDIYFEGLSSREESTISIVRPEAGGPGYYLEFENNRGQFYSVPLVYFDRKNLHYGDELFRLHFIEPLDSSHHNIAQEDFFILTDSEGEDGMTHVVSYERIDPREKRITFVDLAGEMIQADYTGEPGHDAVGELVFDSTKYRFHVGIGPEYRLAVDMDGSGMVSKSETRIVAKGGILLDIGSTEEPRDMINMLMTLPAHKLEGVSEDEEIEFSILVENSNHLNLRLYSQDDLRLKSTRNNLREGRTRSGALFTVTEKNDDAEEMTVEYPLTELEPLVYIIGQPQIRSSGLEISRINMQDELDAGEALNVELMLSNIGLREQKDVKVSVAVPALGISTETVKGTDIAISGSRIFNMNLKLPECVDQDELDALISIDSDDLSIDRYESVSVTGERCSGAAPMFESFSENRAMIGIGDTENYSVKAMDIDSDQLGVEWYFNGRLALEETVEAGKKSSITFAPDEEGEYRIKAVVSDEDNRIEKGWSILVSGSGGHGDAGAGHEDPDDEEDEGELEAGSGRLFYSLFSFIARLMF